MTKITKFAKISLTKQTRLRFYTVRVQVTRTRAIPKSHPGSLNFLDLA